MCKPFLQFLYGTSLIQIQSYLFIISQPKVSFQFLIFKEGSYMVFTSTYFILIHSSLTFWDVHIQLTEILKIVNLHHERIISFLNDNEKFFSFYIAMLIDSCQATASPVPVSAEPWSRDPSQQAVPQGSPWPPPVWVIMIGVNLGRQTTAYFPAFLMPQLHLLIKSPSCENHIRQFLLN